jgi:hypothetical protein
MKTIRLILTSLVAVAAFGFIFSLSKCKKQHDIVVVQVHDTLNGKSITGLCTYPDYSGTMVPAKGAVISLYIGSSVSGNPVATVTSDASGNYKLPYLLPNSYYLYAKYNTANANYKPINGIDFHTDATDPANAVTIGSSNVTKNLLLATEAPTGTKIITTLASDTTGSMGAKDCVPMDTHSNLTWWSLFNGDAYNPSSGGTENTLEGHFGQPGSGGWNLTRFYFDEANPANSTFKGWVCLSKMSTDEPGRDGLASTSSMCVPKSLQVDTSKIGGIVAAVPITDSAWYNAAAGSVVKYGKGYLIHGFMTAFYKSAAGEIEPPRITACTVDSASWDGKGPHYNGPYSQKITKQVDMYLEYQGAKTTWNAAHSTFNKWAIFEAQMDWNRSDFFVNNTSVGNTIHMTPHIQLKGANNSNW